MKSISIEEYRRLASGPAKPAKYRNVKTRYRSAQGFERVYDSKREAARAAELDALVASGPVRWWIPQVPFPIGGGVRYIADFMVCWLGGDVTFEDVKGRDTRGSLDKRKIVKDRFGVEVEIVR